MLTQQSPSAITTNMMCPGCGGCLRLTVIEPYYNGKQLDNHVFAYSKCDEIRIYVFDRTLRVSRRYQSQSALVERGGGIS
jgi:hypothetical protein